MATWFAGRDRGELPRLARVHRAGRYRLVPTGANGQPAFAAYERGPGGAYQAHAVFVLTLTGTGIARIVIFLDPGLFARFALPATLATCGCRAA